MLVIIREDNVAKQWKKSFQKKLRYFQLFISGKKWISYNKHKEMLKEILCRSRALANKKTIPILFPLPIVLCAQCTRSRVYSHMRIVSSFV